MIMPGRTLRRAASAIVAGGLLGVLGGCGASAQDSSATTTTPAITPVPISASSCPGTVLAALSRVVRHVYLDGLVGERPAEARVAIEHSAALRAAVESDDAGAARAAVDALLATGRMAHVLIRRDGRTLVDLGVPAVGPLQGTIVGAGGAPIASYLTSVWSDSALAAESRSITEGMIALRGKTGAIEESLAVPPAAVGTRGGLELGQSPYAYASIPAEGFPSGNVRVYVLRSVASTDQLCGASRDATILDTLARVATLIYDGERGGQTTPQIERVQRYGPLLRAVARRDPAATRRAVESLLTQHVVRLRVIAGHTVLADVGGPYVLAPVQAPLLLGGRTIGRIVLSIQDDEGYKRLTRRLAGLRVLMYMGHRLVKNSLGPEPGTVPPSGAYVYRGREFRVFTLDAEAFPSGPLTIRVLVPIPYS